MNSGQVGRPPIRLDKEDIVALRALRFLWTKIARILGISRQTLYRRLQVYGIAPIMIKIHYHLQS